MAEQLPFRYLAVDGPIGVGKTSLVDRLVRRFEAVKVLEEKGAANDDDPAWKSASIPMSDFAGQTIRIVFEAADEGKASLVEAAVDDVRITRP